MGVFWESPNRFQRLKVAAMLKNNVLKLGIGQKIQLEYISQRASIISTDGLSFPHASLRPLVLFVTEEITRHIILE